jgi:outer membrane protein OmpA-like peptidoglycan-associated protein
MRHSEFLGRSIRPFIILSLFFISGCVATQDWVQTWVPEQLFPLNKRISDNEASLTQMGGRVSNVEGQVQNMAAQIAELNSRLAQTNAKADRALENIQRLKPDRKLVLDFKQGAFFASNSTVMTSEAKKEIDSFLSDLKGDASGGGGLTFVVEGHTDNVGNEKHNYELARIRADNVASYLTTQRKIDPASLSVLSYGETAPAADNNTAAGRAKNRRVEILVYKESITVGSVVAESRPSTR